MTEYVWVLTAGEHYECESLIEVFSTKEKAVKLWNSIKDLPYYPNEPELSMRKYGWHRIVRKELK